MHNRWAFGLGALALGSGAFITLAPLVSAQAGTDLGAFTSPTPNSTFHRGDTITLRLTQSGPLQRGSGASFSSVMFTSDTGCVSASAFGTVYTGVSDREIVVTTPVLPEAKTGPCTISGTEQEGNRDVESVTVEIVDTPTPASTTSTEPAEVAGAEVTNPAVTTSVAGVSSITVSPGPTSAASEVLPVPQVAGVTVAPDQVSGATLPRTGSSTIGQVWLGVALLGAGAVFTVLGKRSRRA